jgi:hypothetical protein
MREAALVIEIISMCLLLVAASVAPFALPEKRHKREIKEIVILGWSGVGGCIIAIILTL